MKHLSIGIIFATLLATVFISCRKGEKGEPGPAGNSSPLLPYKNGSITGTLTGTSRLTDASFSESINYQYYKSPSDNVSSIIQGEGDENIYVITRYDSLGGSYIKFEFSLDSYQDQNGNTQYDIYNPYITISANKKVNNEVFYFGTSTDYYDPFDVSSIFLNDYSSGGNSNFTYDNLTVNSTTGAISFDYSIELADYQNSTQNNAYLEGTISATPYNVSYRQGAE